jgi:hypothetical protein
VVAGVAVVTLNRSRRLLADEVSLPRQYRSERLPMVSVKNTVGQVFHFAVEAPEGCSIAILL